MMRVALGFGVLLVVSTGVLAQAPSWSPAQEGQRCPSKWGAGDERGSANHMKPATVLKAMQLVKTGEVIELGHVLNDKMPFFGTRRFDVHAKRTFMNAGSNRRGSNEEVVVGEIGQVGTQFDGFAHQTVENSWYNCFKVDENTGRGGFQKLGIHNVGAIVTRGVLIDVAALKGVDILPDAYEITVQDLEDALRKQNTIRPSGRRGHHPHGLGEAVGQGERALREILPWAWSESGRVADRQGPHPPRLR